MWIQITLKLLQENAVKLSGDMENIELTWRGLISTKSQVSDASKDLCLSPNFWYWKITLMLFEGQIKRVFQCTVCWTLEGSLVLFLFFPICVHKVHWSCTKGVTLENWHYLNLKFLRLWIDFETSAINLQRFVDLIEVLKLQSRLVIFH